MHGLKKYLTVSHVLIAISVVIALLSRLGESDAVVWPLQISDPFSSGLDDVLHGQLWRLVTPIFLHFSVPHLVFNMMATWDLGRLIDMRKSPVFFIAFVFVVGIVSNLVQYFFAGSPKFGGMSGVLYGLFGYIWMQGRYNPRFGFVLHQNSVIMMLGWFVLCWFNFLGPIANWAHTAGLVAGVIWGYLGRKA